MPHLKSIYQNRPKIKLFLQKKIQTFRALGLRPQIPETAPPPYCRCLATRLSLIIICTSGLWRTGRSSRIPQTAPPTIAKIWLRA